MADTGKLTPQLQEFLMQEQVRAQVQQTVAKVTETCFDKCISAPGRSFSSREESCLTECARRYIDTTQFVLQRFQQQGGGNGGGLQGGF